MGGSNPPLLRMDTRKRIFIIDDEKYLLSILGEYFQNQGVEAVTYGVAP